MSVEGGLSLGSHFCLREEEDPGINDAGIGP